LARRRGKDEWTGGATTPHPSMLRLIRIAAVLAAARPTLLFRPVECRAAEAKRVAVLLRWQADGGEVSCHEPTN